MVDPRKFLIVNTSIEPTDSPERLTFGVTYGDGVDATSAITKDAAENLCRQLLKLLGKEVKW